MLSLMLSHILLIIFFYNDTATTNIYPLSLHDALPIFERPAGRRLLTVTMIPERLAAPEEVSFLPALTLRRIPNSRLGASQPSICELIRTDYSAAPATSAAGTPELWTGRSSVTMDSASEFDPLVAMAPVRTLGALYAVADITLPLGTPVRDYLAEAEVAEQPAFT